MKRTMNEEEIRRRDTVSGAHKRDARCERGAERRDERVNKYKHR